jgi:hypothetical protein
MRPKKAVYNIHHVYADKYENLVNIHHVYIKMAVSPTRIFSFVSAALGADDWDAP